MAPQGGLDLQGMALSAPQVAPAGAITAANCAVFACI